MAATVIQVKRGERFRVKPTAGTTATVAVKPRIVDASFGDVTVDSIFTAGIDAELTVASGTLESLDSDDLSREDSSVQLNWNAVSGALESIVVTKRDGSIYTHAVTDTATVFKIDLAVVS